MVRSNSKQSKQSTWSALPVSYHYSSRKNALFNNFTKALTYVRIQGALALSSHLDMEHSLEISKKYRVVSGRVQTVGPFSMVPAFQAKRPLTGHRLVVEIRALHPEIPAARGFGIWTSWFLIVIVESRLGQWVANRNLSCGRVHLWVIVMDFIIQILLRVHWGNEWPPQEDVEVFSWS